jgi:hypothetical protein
MVADGVTKRGLVQRAEALSNNQDAIVRFGIKREGKAALISVVIVRTPLSVASSAAGSATSSSAVSARSTVMGPAPSTPTSGLGGGLGAGAGTYSAAGHGALAAGALGLTATHSAGGYESSGYSSCGSNGGAYDSGLSDRYESDVSTHSRCLRRCPLVALACPITALCQVARCHCDAIAEAQAQGQQGGWLAAAWRMPMCIHPPRR